MGRGIDAIDAYLASGNAHSVAAGRISYTLGLQGPAVAIDGFHAIACARQGPRQKIAHGIIVIGKQNPNHSFALFPPFPATVYESRIASTAVPNNSAIVRLKANDYQFKDGKSAFRSIWLC